MGIEYIEPLVDDSTQQNVIFENNTLPAEYVFAHRKKVTVQDPHHFVFSAQSPEEISQVMALLVHLKTDTGNKPLPLQQIPATFLAQAYIVPQSDGKAGLPAQEFTTALQSMSTPPQFEIHYGNSVLLINQGGASYINPKGEAAPQSLVNGERRNIPAFWLQFYDKTGSNEDKQALVKEKVHFYTVEQQAEAYEGTDFMVQNAALLCRDVHAKPEAFKAVKKMPRSEFFASINGEPDPRDPKKAPLKLVDKSDEKKDAAQRSERKKQIEATISQHGIFHEEAVRKTEEAKNTGRLHAFRSNPENAWAEVMTAAPPEYIENEEDLNKFSTVREELDVSHNFELKGPNIIAKSTGGKVTFMDRYTWIAEDLRLILNRDEGLELPIVINSVKPASQTEVCKAAFEKIFGIGAVKIGGDKPDPDDEVDSSSSITAAAPSSLSPV